MSDPKFRISSALKDVIGRELITDKNVAVFELVKNAYDAHATSVQVEFGDNEILIIDDGKGMSRDDILNKWLFVAYSAKREGGDEDAGLPPDYRDRIGERRGYAGNKGIGRFSCDSLGTTLDLYSRPVGGKRVEHLKVDWTSFEEDSEAEFGTIEVVVSHKGAFPEALEATLPEAHGTVLKIGGLRNEWAVEDIRRLRRYLAKLVDPFRPNDEFELSTLTPALQGEQDVEGPVGNDIIDLLDEKTTRIEVSIDKDKIESSLVDRGVLIYRIKEKNKYKDLKKATISVDLYYLNRSAKHTFTSRMGVRPVKFGHLFLFVNGFRIFPVGEETDDSFGLGRRKQQGHARYLGPRDILGAIRVKAPPRTFLEASSRNDGLVQNEAAIALRDAVINHVVRRLERYVITVNWPDRLDKDRADASGLRSDAARSRIISVVRALVGSKDIKLIDYDKGLINVINERAEMFEESMEGLAAVAEETGDRALRDRVKRSLARYKELRRAEQEALERADEEARARKRAELRAERVGVRLERVEEQARLLRVHQAREDEELALLHHQVVIYATELKALVARSLRNLAKDDPPLETISADLERIAFQNSRVLATTRFATQVNFRLDSSFIKADFIQFVREYLSDVIPLYGDSIRINFDDGSVSLPMRFKPIDVSIVLDNLVSNARRAKATRMEISCRKSKIGPGIELKVDDNGRGIDTRRVDPGKIFEKGYTGTIGGTGLGLYHARQVVEQMGGSLALDPNREEGAASFLMWLPEPKEE